MRTVIECASCGDVLPDDHRCQAPKCKRRNDLRCSECHAEKYHGAIPNVTGDGKLGGNPRGAGKERGPSPWEENNVRIMEDGGSR